MIISAGIVPVRMTDKGYVFLLLRSFGTFYDFPKGRVEVGEDSLEAAIRETFEEASISADELEFKWGTDSYTTKPFNGHHGTKVGKYFVAETNKEHIVLPVNPELGKPEHDIYCWVTYREGQEITNHRIGGVLQWARRKIES